MVKNLKLLRVLFDIDMRCRHEGLKEQLIKRKVSFKKMELGDLVCFINTVGDRLMVLAPLQEQESYGVLGYYRSPHGRIDPMAIKYVVEAFGGGVIDMDKATKLALEERLGKKR